MENLYVAYISMDGRVGPCAVGPMLTVRYVRSVNMGEGGSRRGKRFKLEVYRVTLLKMLVFSFG